jgi:hypothetical protein
MKLGSTLFILFFFVSAGCRKKTEVTECNDRTFMASFTSRNFSMGFTTWPFGADYADRESTYSFISTHADIYSEQMDNYIPWRALINNQPLPGSLTNDIASRLALRPQGHRLLLSVSLLNIERDNLLADSDGYLPAYAAIDDTIIVNAYSRYMKILIGQFQPDYVVLAMEVNEFKIKKAQQWTAYQSLIQSVKENLKAIYPQLKTAESVTLHNWYQPDVSNPEDFSKEIGSYVNQQDFIAISFYPFLKGQHTASEFRKAFTFLHAMAQKPVAFVETGHIAEDLTVPAFNLSVKSDVCEQKEYLEELLQQAKANNYEFIIWWTHRDYDKLWQIFPDETKDIGLLWKDSGLLEGDGKERAAMASWKHALGK